MNQEQAEELLAQLEDAPPGTKVDVLDPVHGLITVTDIRYEADEERIVIMIDVAD